MALNYMVFMCRMDRAANVARKLGEPYLSQVREAKTRAIEYYKAKDYVSAEQWMNAAIRASLKVN